MLITSCDIFSSPTNTELKFVLSQKEYHFFIGERKTIDLLKETNYVWDDIEIVDYDENVVSLEFDEEHQTITIKAIGEGTTYPIIYANGKQSTD